MDLIPCEITVEVKNKIVFMYQTWYLGSNYKLYKVHYKHSTKRKFPLKQFFVISKPGTLKGWNGWKAAASRIHFQSKIKYKFVLYEENTGHMHQIAPLTTLKCKKLSLWTPSPPPPPCSLASLPRTYFFSAPSKIKSWLRHWLNLLWMWSKAQGDWRGPSFIIPKISFEDLEIQKIS